MEDPLFGRVKELEQIATVGQSCAALNKPFVLIMSAPGGFGKTKLAYAAWNLLLGWFTGPKLWARLRGQHQLTVCVYLIRRANQLVCPLFYPFQLASGWVRWVF